MLLNFNELVSGGYFGTDVDNGAFLSLNREILNSKKGLRGVLNDIEAKGVTVDGKIVPFDFYDNHVLSYLRYCFGFIESYPIIDFSDFRDYIDFWYEEGFTKNQNTRKGFHPIAFDNYSEAILFYAVVFYIAELYLGY